MAIRLKTPVPIRSLNLVILAKQPGTLLQHLDERTMDMGATDCNNMGAADCNNMGAADCNNMEAADCNSMGAAD